MHFLNYMELLVNLQIIIPHKKMEFLNKKIGIQWNLFEICYNLLNCQSFWGEAIAITCYLQNQSYPSIFSGKTPYECWRGKKPSLHHIKVFRCITYAHVSNDTKKL